MPLVYWPQTHEVARVSYWLGGAGWGIWAVRRNRAGKNLGPEEAGPHSATRFWLGTPRSPRIPNSHILPDQHCAKESIAMMEHSLSNAVATSHTGQ